MNIHDQNPSLFNNSLYLNVKFRLTSNGRIREYFGHREILASQSLRFRAMFQSGSSEASQPIIDIQHDDPELFPIMLKYLYDKIYPTDPLGATTTGDKAKQLKSHIGLWLLGHNYEILRLQREATEHFIKDSTWYRQLPSPTNPRPSAPSWDLEDREAQIILSLVPYFYQDCHRSGTSMGLAISKAVKNLPWIPQSRYNPDRVRLFAKVFSGFGADWVEAMANTMYRGRCSGPDGCGRVVVIAASEVIEGDERAEGCQNLLPQYCPFCGNGFLRIVPHEPHEEKESSDDGKVDEAEQDNATNEVDGSRGREMRLIGWDVDEGDNTMVEGLN